MLKKVMGGIFILGQLALANNIGIGYGLTSPIYQNDNNDYILPIVDINYGKFFIKGSSSYGISIGAKVIEEDNYVLSLYGMPYGGFEVKNDDMKDGYKGIDDRKTHFMGGAQLEYYVPEYNVVASTSVEYGEKGGNFNLKLSKPYKVSEKLTLIPTINYTYYNSEMVDYYFGIDYHELNGQKIRNTYDGEGAHRYGVGLFGDYKLRDDISLLAFTGLTKLSSEITNSPIADKEWIYLFGTGIMYTF